MTERETWLLVFLGGEGGDFATDQVRVMNGMFLLSRVPGHPVARLYRFEPYNRRPLAPAVEFDLEVLKIDGLVHVQRWANVSRRTYEVTDAGVARLSEIVPGLPPDQVAAAHQMKLHATSLPLEELLAETAALLPPEDDLSQEPLARAVG